MTAADLALALYATIAMFIGLCSAYVGSYVGTWTAFKNSTPLLVAGISTLAMAVFEYLIVKEKKWSGWKISVLQSV